MSSGGEIYWVRNDAEEFVAKGIVVVFAWVSMNERQLTDYVNLYSSLGWNSLICLADFLNPFILERATTLAFSVLSDLIKVLKLRPCPVVLAAFSGGSKACMYKVFQVIEGGCEVQLSLEDCTLVRSCISGQIYDSDPVDFTRDLGARFALHRSILKMPGSAKLLSWFARGLTSSLDALFLTRFGFQRTEYWQTLYTSVALGAPFLIFCSENDDLAPYSIVRNFAQRLQDMGGNVKVVKWNASAHAGHYEDNPIQYASAVAMLLEQAVSVFSNKIQKLGEGSYMDDMHDEISELICDLQKVAVNSNQSFRRIAVGPSDHFFLPSSAENQNVGESGSLQERKERSPDRSNPCMSPHGILGQVLFDVCVPKNIEGWDIKFSGSTNRQPVGSVDKKSPLNALKYIRRSRL